MLNNNDIVMEEYKINLTADPLCLLIYYYFF